MFNEFLAYFRQRIQEIINRTFYFANAIPKNNCPKPYSWIERLSWIHEGRIFSRSLEFNLLCLTIFEAHQVQWTLSTEQPLLWTLSIPKTLDPLQSPLQDTSSRRQRTLQSLTCLLNSSVNVSWEGHHEMENIDLDYGEVNKTMWNANIVTIRCQTHG